MNSVVRRLAQAGWIDGAFVNQDIVDTHFTAKGADGMRQIWEILKPVVARVAVKADHLISFEELKQLYTIAPFLCDYKSLLTSGEFAAFRCLAMLFAKQNRIL